MKVRLRDLIEKYKRQIIIASIILAAILVLVLLYIFVIGPWIEFKWNEKKLPMPSKNTMTEIQVTYQRTMVIIGR